MEPRPNRRSQAGVTLVEVLVVLVLIGIMAGVVGLNIGSGNRGNAVAGEAQLLVARLNRAADEAVLTGAPMAFVWSDTAYRFVTFQDDVWIAHPIGILGTPHALDSGLQLRDDQTATSGEFVVLASLRPANSAALRLTIAGNDSAQTVMFDGATAQVPDAAGP